MTQTFTRISCCAVRVALQGKKEMDTEIRLLLVLVALLITGASTGANASCVQPESIDNGVTSYSGTSSGDTVTYRCRIGYVLDNGDGTRICQSNGTWTGTTPQCVDMDSYFTFTCDINGTIMALNPDPASLIWHHAYNEDGACNSFFTGGNVSVIITGCALDKVIMLVFSPFPDGVPSLITDKIRYYNITCQSLPLEGINIVVTDSTWVKNLMSTSREPSQSPIVVVNANLQIADTTTDPSGNGTGVSPTASGLTSLKINEKLRWTISVPEPYIVFPVNCTAFSGEVDSLGTRYSLHVIENGCSLDISLITDFQHLDPDHARHVAYADIYAFRFPGSNDVQIDCVVRACPPGSTACDFNCAKRKKRDVSYSHELDTGVHFPMQKRYDIETADKTVDARIKFRVYGPPNVGLEYLTIAGGGVQIVWRWSVMLAFFLHAVL